VLRERAAELGMSRAANTSVQVMRLDREPLAARPEGLRKVLLVPPLVPRLESAGWTLNASP
jgi:hypothetical protein